ncbi:MAG: hypothetical protein Q8R28_09450 [Dehalococcoidia bacterium]|nr:hypothetical protein [Dehalococcoidia bacterium]
MESVVRWRQSLSLRGKLLISILAPSLLVGTNSESLDAVLFSGP